jgi:hypothetical protein
MLRIPKSIFIEFFAIISLVSSGPSKPLLDVLVNCAPCVDEGRVLLCFVVLEEECVLSCVQEVDDDVLILLVRLKKAIVGGLWFVALIRRCCPSKSFLLYSFMRKIPAAGLKCCEAAVPPEKNPTSFIHMSLS